jgi:predicted DNA-binding protein
MNTVRSNITLPESINNELNAFAEELNEKKSHIIAAALERYFDYLDIKVAEKRLNDNEEVVSMEEFFKEFDLDVQN